MKKSLFALVFIITSYSYSQEHFAGISTSSRVGILNASNNPAELVNMKNTFEGSLLSTSINVSNNKVGFNDLFSNTSLETLIFKGNDPVNLRADAEIYGPSFGFKFKKWAFGITSKIQGKLDIVDVDPNLGDALVNSGLSNLLGSSTSISNDYNQRMNGTTWGEIGFTGARNLLDNERYKFSVGATFKLLFPGSYANLGLDKFNGTITASSLGQVDLRNTTANLNIAYSGGLANSFSNFNDYSKSVFGGLNGFSGDLGVNFQWKDATTASNKYKLNTGLSIRNIGSMTFKDTNNNSTNYNLSIQGNQSLNLNQFENVDNLQQIETILLNSGFLTKTNSNKDFKVKLPTTLNLYADVKLISKLYITGFLQQKINDNNDNDQITVQNVFTVTPRFTTGIFEIFAPFNSSEISGFTSGIGFRVGGFYLGSSSIVTALITDSKQGDIYTGFRWGFL